MTLDDVDRRLLRALQDDCRQTLESLAAASGLSPSATQRRIRRLREEGIIEAEVAVLSAKRLGYPIRLVVSVSLRGENHAQAQAFRDRMRAMPEVSQCFLVTGETDYLLLCHVESMEAFEAGLGRVLFDDPLVDRFSTSVVLVEVKPRPTVPV